MRGSTLITNFLHQNLSLSFEHQGITLLTEPNQPKSTSLALVFNIQYTK